MIDISQVLARQGHCLLLIGTALLVYSSIDGFVIPYLASPRIGLSVHTLSAYQGPTARSPRLPAVQRITRATPCIPLMPPPNP